MRKYRAGNTSDDGALVSTDDFFAEYFANDAALFAIAIGYGNSAETYRSDIAYILERSRNDNVGITIASAFWWTLLFRAVSAEERGYASRDRPLPSFPPPMLQSLLEIFAQRFLHQTSTEFVNVKSWTVLHLANSITWTANAPTQLIVEKTTVNMVRVRGHVLQVRPKSVGTILNVCINFYEHHEKGMISSQEFASTSPFVTMTMTLLILGLPPEQVAAYQYRQTTKSPRVPPSLPRLPSTPPGFQFTHRISTNTALLYRLASGDSNRIHVDPIAMKTTRVLMGDDNDDDDDDSDNEEGEESSPRNRQRNRPGLPLILHGLCTMGIASRYLEQVANGSLRVDKQGTAPANDTLSANRYILRHLTGQFARPVLLGDSLWIQIWPVAKDHKSQTEDEQQFVFRVVKVPQNETQQDDADEHEAEIVVLDKGFAVLRLCDERSVINSSKEKAGNYASPEARSKL